MRIVVCVRTLNEEDRIERFCNAYSWADHILVADGGSEDRTVDLALMFENVIVRPFFQRINLENDYWRNNDSDHANFLFQWAYTMTPEWVIYDDCDMLPNFVLQQWGRAILEETDVQAVMLTKLYLWGKDRHFPNMAKPAEPHVRYEPSLWAWRGNLDLWTINVPPAYDFRVGETKVNDFNKEYNTLSLYPPFCALHYSWDDPQKVEEKVKRYRESGLIPTQLHPLEFAGEPVPLPFWARLERDE